jgi:hydrogenase-4 component B
MLSGHSLILIALAVIACSGIPSLLFHRHPKQADTLGAAFAFTGAAIGFVASINTLLANITTSETFSWTLPFGDAQIGIDPLTSFFLLPIFLISGCVAVYGSSYMSPKQHPKAATVVRFFSGFLVASMGILVMSRNSFLFILSWEVMALSAYIFMFLMLRVTTGSFIFPQGGTLAAAGTVATLMFMAAFIGFGMKAGMIPFHVWLPAAHANAPSHVSAIMSAVILKMGIYGIMRFTSFFAAPPVWWGTLLFVTGLFSAILGILFALGQQDLKRLLAYSSIENIGIITLGIGTHLLGKATGSSSLALLGLAGALLHILNHSLFKSLLFFCAGAIIHKTHTRKLDLMGGLGRVMPITATLSLFGIIALTGLPPLNGFIGEYLLYIGFFKSAVSGSSTTVLSNAAAIVGLSLVGALATATFVRVYSAIFSGTPHQQAPGHNDPSALMLAPMLLLAGLCIVMGLVPQQFFMLLEPVLTQLGYPSALSHLDFHTGLLSIANLILLLTIALLALWLFRSMKRPYTDRAPTWGCGYLQPTARMQYSASSFSEFLVKIFSGIIRPRFVQPTINQCFPPPSCFMSKIPETELERVVLPFFTLLRDKFGRLRRLQHGQLHLYILYMFAILILLAFWSHIRTIALGGNLPW